MLSIKNLTKQRLPTLPLAAVADHALTPDYDLSLVFIGDKKSHELNLSYRQKDKPTNILSFPLDQLAGEIFINLDMVGTEELLFLFIHGVLHLKGMTHGSTMEREEQKMLKLFSGSSTHGQKSHHRTGHRNRLDSPRGL